MAPRLRPPTHAKSSAAIRGGERRFSHSGPFTDPRSASFRHHRPSKRSGSARWERSAVRFTRTLVARAPVCRQPDLANAIDSSTPLRQRSAVPEIAALIPALECEATVAEVVCGVRAHVSRVLVVDDGSTDRTEERAKEAGADVVRHPINRGKGAALRTGFEILSDRGATHVVTLDGDGQHLPEEIPALLRASAAQPGALIVGARPLDPEHVGPLRLFGNRFANRWVEIACGASLPDTQSGLRVYPLRDTLALRCRADRFAFETEVLIRATRAGMPLRSVPVRVYEAPEGEHRSHFRPWSDAARIVLTVIGLMLRVW